MITRMLILLGAVLSLCPFLPPLPLPHELFYLFGAACGLLSARVRWAPYGLIFFTGLAVGISQLEQIGLRQLPLEHEDALWRGSVKIMHVRHSNISSNAHSQPYAQVQAKVLATDAQSDKIGYSKSL